jgi:serine/threonine protein kinase
VGLLVLLVLLLLAVVVVVLARRRKDGRDDWEIDLDHELELGTVLGTGGFGEVYRATWKGTEVAVKKMVLASSDRSTKEMEKNFRDEVNTAHDTRHTAHGRGHTAQDTLN